MRHLVWMLALALAAQDGRIESLAPYTPTPELVVHRMLALAGLKPGEKLFDLGSGDARIVIAAAQRFKADAVGVELDESLYRQSTKRIASLGLSAKARIIPGDLMNQDYSTADVITV